MKLKLDVNFIWKKIVAKKLFIDVVKIMTSLIIIVRNDE